MNVGNGRDTEFYQRYWDVSKCGWDWDTFMGLGGVDFILLELLPLLLIILISI